MSMDPMMGDAAGAAADAPAPSDASPDNLQACAAACAALELACGSPDFQAAVGGGDPVEIAEGDAGAFVVSCGDVEVNVSAEQIAASMGEELAEVEAMPDPDGGAA